MNKVLLAVGLALILVILAGCLELPGQSAPLTERKQISINEDWAYYAENADRFSMLANALPDQIIDIPHTWNQWDATDNLPGYRRDASWYHKKVAIPDHKGAHYLLYFEGSNISTKVYVNQRLAGTHEGGYVGFEIDITPFVNVGDINDIAIRVDNSYRPDIIPSQKSDFFIYGGITRDLWLNIIPGSHLKNLMVKTPAVSTTAATTELSVELEIAANLRSALSLRAELKDPTGKTVLREAKKISEKTQQVQWTLPTISDPALWSPDSPSLYHLEVALYAGEQKIDATGTTLGYRWYEFIPNGPFLLNGERLLIRGTHRHEEHAGYGAAMPNEIHRRDMEMIKAMGANFVRLGHYPQDPEIYRACDELGLIIWDELPWCRGGVGDDAWMSNVKRLFSEQIQQNYNHPSVFFWSVGNEVYWLPDYPGGGDTMAINQAVTTLNDLAHSMDPGRLTAIRKYYEGAGLIDVFSPSIWSGWYAGVYKNYETALEKNRLLYPRFIHMEYGGSSHPGRHTETPITGDGTIDPDDWTEAVNQAGVQNIAKTGDWTENYIVDLFDWHLQVSENSEWFGGNAQWAFKDFGTPLRPENPIPYVNQKGLVDRSGQPKDAFYVFKSYWSDEPFAYIESHTWTERAGPAGKAREVSVFSNGEILTLSHNGKALGRRTRNGQIFPAAGLSWLVQFEEGNNELITIAYKGGQQVASDTLNVNYTFERPGKPDHIEMSSRPLSNGNLMIEATMVDKKGNRVLDYEERIYFDANGNGRLLANYGTPSRSEIIEMANGKAMIEMELGPGKITIEARNQDFKGAYIVLNIPTEATPQP